jgi:ATP-dependent DNA ligase
MKAIDRFLRVEDYSTIYNNPYIEWAKYYNGKELWDMLQHLLANGYEGMVITYEDAPYQPGKRSNKVSLKVKRELQDTIDCVIIGANTPTKLSGTKEPESWEWWFNETTNEKILASEYFAINHESIYKFYVNGGPVVPVTKGWFYGWAGSLKLGLYNGDKLIHVGDLSGIDESIKANWRDYVNTVVEISCMEIHDTGGLRHPRALNFMRDKNPKDCIVEQIR